VPFLALTFDTDAGAAEAWADALLAHGALSVDASDPRAGTAEETPLYGEPGEPGVELWPVSRLRALFPADTVLSEAIAGAAAELGEPMPAYEAGEIADQDWVRLTQSQFGPIEVASGFWIVPTWCEPPAPSALNLRLDPGLAFGTGSHPTTRLCLSWLAAADLIGRSVLDYGCGSGVLAIAAAKLGAGYVAGVDVDPQAVAASRDNATRNAVVATFSGPDALAPATFDVVVANILANPLVLLAPVLGARVRTGGHIALSGILESQEHDVAEAYGRWFIIGAAQRADGWVLMTGVRRDPPR
jgi:ribosomal protein L11 methyltransferase